MTYFNNAHPPSFRSRVRNNTLRTRVRRRAIGFGHVTGPSRLWPGVWGGGRPPGGSLKKMKFPAYCRQKHLRHLPRIFRTFGKGKGGHCLGVKVDGPPSANPEGGTPRGRGKACSKILRDDGTLDLDPPCVAPPISEGLTLPRKGRLPSHSDTFLS